jgi:putative exosortase-associated protein (TIGR04073 family)
MKKYFSSLFLISLISTLTILSSSVQANENATNNNVQERSYGDIVGRKAATGFANIAVSVLEIPKNIINTSNESNILFGVTGGALKGFIHMFGRLAVGIVDTTTMFFPTKSIVEPAYPWENFYTETDYKPMFIYDSGKN